MLLEKLLWNELKIVLNNPKLHLKDIQEWSQNGDIVQNSLRPETEVYVTCTVDEITFHCAVLKTADKRTETNNEPDQTSSSDDRL